MLQMARMIAADRAPSGGKYLLSGTAHAGGGCGYLCFDLKQGCHDATLLAVECRPRLCGLAAEVLGAPGEARTSLHSLRRLGPFPASLREPREGDARVGLRSPAVRADADRYPGLVRSAGVPAGSGEECRFVSEREFYDALLLFWFALAAVLFVVLLRIPAPYGRHSRAGWGATLGARTGWFIMEAPASLLFALWFSLGRGISSTILLVFFVMWQAHYFHRAFIYPFTLGATARRVPVVVVMLGMLFNSVNTYLNGSYLFAFSAGYATAWVSGFALRVWHWFSLVAGYVLNGTLIGC